MVEDHLTDAQFRRIASLVENHTGIRVPASKRIMVEARLRKRVRALGLPDLSAYAALLAGDAPEDEFPHFINCMTTNKTDFFREPVHFDVLRDRVAPELLRRDSKRPLTLWSAACSTGAEPYTIAMVLDAMAREAPFRYRILATDISTDVLAQARRAVFQLDMAAPIPPEMRRRYVLTSRDPGRAEFRIAPELRANVGFGHLNLMDARYGVENDVDVIFCRNVLIYFDRDVQHAVLTRLVSHLRPGGYLFLGHSESMAGVGLSVRQVLPTVYQKAAAPKRLAAGTDFPRTAAA
ncbi:chemotaxis protein methyltransferase [Alsobacter metallidurans]|uniref:Chemotaxis protein methyltransferase n=1 Tax=Alsobacter metallidurans TaxID=340221 RepID=A0A917MKI2_9HYPH|nr:protein-glutamate O-methyltransferase [Alsobacter metallidurans]GGH23904.1 chemotaxis protein methyltransferase [Alsobacter metallidurans]